MLERLKQAQDLVWAVSRLPRTFPKPQLWLALFSFGIALSLLRVHDTSSLTGGFSRQAGIRAASQQLETVRNQVAALSQQQSTKGVTVIDTSALGTALEEAQVKISGRQIAAANQLVNDVQGQVAQTQGRLDLLGKTAVATPAVTVPILTYHHTPADFEQQLAALKQKGYTTIDLNQLAGALLLGATLPPKPVVISFDDGYVDNLGAFDLLRKHQMKATFFIANGGEASGRCIGPNRQPGLPCGDAYLTWDQIKQLDQSGLITIGAHTVDHLRLTSVSQEMKRFQILHSKHELESRLGHKVHHFAYPYGALDQATVNEVKEAGFVTAATTQSELTQNQGHIHSLYRVRGVTALP